MDQGDAEPTVIEGQLELPTVPPPGTIVPPENDTTDVPDLDELLDYKPVPPRRVVTLSIRYWRGVRLTPLPYERGIAHVHGRPGSSRNGRDGG
jgi:hypothetical protein